MATTLQEKTGKFYVRHKINNLNKSLIVPSK